MKKLFLLFTTAACIVALAGFTPAGGGKSFEGVIVFDVEFQSSALPPEALAMLEGSKVTTYLKPGKSRVEMQMGPSQNITIVDHKAKTSVTLTDMMGEKIMLKTNLAEENKKETGKTDIKYVEGTKEISGYKCKKAEVTVTQEDGTTNKMDVYYTEDLPYDESYSSNGMKGLKGFPLEYSISNGMIDMHFKAKSITKESVPDSRFDIPEGYKEMTKEEFQNTYGGGQ